MKRWKEHEEWSKRQDHTEQIKHFCKCGHVVYVPKRNTFAYCTWCYRKVYQDKRAEFEYKLFRSLGKVNNEEVR